MIVPVRDDHAGLARCIDAILAQDIGRERFEVIVVDDGSATPVDTGTDPRGVRYLRQEAAGSYAARNLGISVARGAVLAFTDADCLPAPGWLSGAAAALAGRDDVFLAGDVRFTFRAADAPNAFELYDSLTFLQQRHLVEHRHFGATANLIVPAAAMARVGRFRADLLSGGDGEWGARARRLGVAGRFSGQAVVLHPARASAAQLLRKWRRVLGGFADLRAKSAGRADYRPPREVFPAGSRARIRRLPAVARAKVSALAVAVYAYRQLVWLRLLAAGRRA